jgi:glycosyltransferase involved in cell wall biosynthesis
MRTLRCQQGIALCAIILNEGRLANELRDCGADVLVIPESTTGFREILAIAANFLRARNIDVLHSHRYKENLLAVLLARRCRIPVVVRSEHGLREPFRGLRFWKQAVIQFADRLLARYRTDTVISVTAEMQAHLASGLGAKKIVVIPNGIDPAAVISVLTPAEAKARLGIAPQSPVVGTAGRLDAVKRLDMFIAAAKQIRSQLPMARFVIAGEGTQESALRSSAASAGLGDAVLFLGHRDDVYDVIRAMDVFVICSDHEGLPMVLLEAMQLGVPVVARAVGGIPEVLGEAPCGKLVCSSSPSELAEACVAMLNEPERASLVEAARRRVSEHFSVARTAANAAELYRSLVHAR